MLTHDLKQGTPEWAAYRTAHDNASDAPAMLGESSYKTREQLIAEVATGIVPEVNAATQRLFDSGHRFEALARPLAEAIIEQDLYPCTGSLEGSRLSASFDGLTMAEDLAFEHKRLNQRLRAVLSVPGCTGADLPMEYQIQMEQQCAVSGCEKVLFMATNWADDDTLIEELHCWYYPNLELRARIVAGWEQFHKDVAAYVAPEAKPAPVVAAPMETLPAVSVRVDGQLAIVSNLPAFGAALRNFIDRIPAKPSTDQEFADTEAACKALKQTEDALEAAESNALAQLADVDTMRRFVADYRALARTTRLQREKLVAQRKEEIRGEIVAGGANALREHIASLNTRLGKPYMPQVAADFAGVIKGKRTVDSLRGAVNDELARAKIAANEIADRIQVNLNTLREMAKDHVFLFADTPTIVLKAADDLTTLVKARIAEHQAKEDKRIADEKDRLQKEADAAATAKAAEHSRMLMSEISGIQQQVAIAQLGRAGVRKGGTIECIRETLAETESWVIDAEYFGAMAGMAQSAKDTAVEQIKAMLAAAERRALAIQAEKDAQDSIADANATQELPAPLAQDLSTLAREKTQEAVAGIDAAQAISTAQRAAAAGPAVVQPLCPTLAPTTPPSLKLGEIEKRLGFPLSAAFLFGLGFKPAAKVGAHGVYHEADFPHMLAALVRHIESVQAKAAA